MIITLKGYTFRNDQVSYLREYYRYANVFFVINPKLESGYTIGLVSGEKIEISKDEFDELQEQLFGRNTKVS